ncbi:tRNA uridine-5-carboxymethylaminomethyl(34) synthesis enzyme MnmG [Candidatus Vidania fulgoroideorum]
MKEYDIIIVGGGHAGIEASNVCCKMGLNTLLITNSIDSIGKLSCNPSIGGVGKSHLVSELDAMGGIMPLVADKSGLNFKLLNTSKGKAVRSTRIQVDKKLYSQLVLKNLIKSNRLHILQQNVKDILISKGKVYGVLLEFDFKILCSSIVIASGTFLGCKVSVGSKKKELSRDNEKYVSNLSEKLSEYIKGISKFKTGTPPRVNINTINLNLLKCMKNDYPLPFFHKRPKHIKKGDFCWITKTNDDTRKIIVENIKKSSMYNGLVKAIGPRYCPSIEDKIFRFPSNRNHTVFLELESNSSNEVYVGGLSTSFDFETQYKIINSIKGLKDSVITRFGYSIEYFFFNPKYLKKTLESKFVSGLFMAGQVNGTTGYEEAAVQGLVAGINSSNLVKGNKPLIPCKKLTYIGILINDITKNGVKEPYRMFTSRATNRIMMRQDNSIYRINRFCFLSGLKSKSDYLKIKNEHKACLNFIKKSKNIHIKYKGNRKSLFNIMLNNELDIEILLSNKYISFYIKKIGIFNFRMLNYIDSEIKYMGYYKKLVNLKVKDKFKKVNFEKVNNLSNETRENIRKYKVNCFLDLKKIKNLNSSCLENIKNYIKKISN